MGDASMVMREPTTSPSVKIESQIDDSDIPVATSTLASSDNDEFSQAIKIIESQRIKITALENALLTRPKGNPGADEALKKMQINLENTQNTLSEIEKSEHK